MNKRIISFLLSFLIIILCGCKNSDKKDAPSETSEVTLRFYGTLGGASDASATQEVLADYTAENSHITLYYSSVVSDEAYKLSLADGSTYRQNSPDIVYAPLYAVRDLLSEEYVSVKELRGHMPDFASEITEHALLCDSSGQAYGIPVRGEGSVLVLNTDLASDTRDLIKIVNEISDSDVYLFADNALDSALFFQYLMTVYTNSEISPDAPQKHWIDGFRLFSELVKMGAFAPGDKNPTELFLGGKAVFAVLNESEASALKGENYKCAAFFGGFTEGFFITRSAFSSPLKRQTAMELADKLISQKDIYAQGKIAADGSGVFFSLESAYSLTPNEEKYGAGCWDDVISSLTKGDEPSKVLDLLMAKPVSDSDR